MSISTRRRVEKLEAAYTTPPSIRAPRRFIIRHKFGTDAVEELRAQGHDVRDGDIVRIIITPTKAQEARP